MQRLATPLLALAWLALGSATALGCTDQAGPHAQPQVIPIRGTNYTIRFRSNMPESQRYVDDRLMTLIARVAIITQKDVLITSGYRNCQKNASVGGANKSVHLRALAVDFAVDGYNSEQLRQIAFQAGANGAGSYYKGSPSSRHYTPASHLDLGAPRTWQNNTGP